MILTRTHGHLLVVGQVRAQLALDVAAAIASLHHGAAPQVLLRGGHVAL